METSSSQSHPTAKHPQHPDSAPETLADMLRPPVNRLMRSLDRSFFQKTVPLAAATVFDKRQIGPVKNALTKTKEICDAPRLIPIRNAPRKGEMPEEGFFWDLRKEMSTSELRDKDALKCLLLNEKVKPDDKTTWSPILQELVDKATVEVQPYKLFLDYDYWTYQDIITSILPEQEVEEAPVGFSHVGHVAHFNMRDEYLPYRYLIAEILLDKQSTVKSVINKIDDVGSTSKFRTFDYELLGGDPNMNVHVRQQNCDFYFDYSKVYWNSRLEAEHMRLVDKFKRGETVCDVMAGVGPFALPAAKKQCFVWANDLNPHGFDCMKLNARKNKVQDFVRPSCQDGRAFIKRATHQLYSNPPVSVPVVSKAPKAVKQRPSSPKSAPQFKKQK
ncbi:tRNA(m(1)G37)methyltransferase, partial [Ascosphaera atra]